ncbi:MAG: hypothetical protein GY786_02015 [Proteobacteria bacterium]|nr:hypothetical protein [Pseudomonadota bacterium]
MAQSENTPSAIENDVEQEEQIVIDRFPTTPEFLGKNDSFKYVTTPPAKLLQKKIDVSDIRTELNRKKRSSIIDPKVRNKLNGLLSKYPDSAELNALNSIMKFSDLQQSSSTDRLINFESIVIILGRAVSTDLYNFNTLSWFLRIYCFYLDQLQITNAKKGYSIAGMDFHSARKQILALKRLAEKSISEFDSFISKFTKTGYFRVTLGHEEVKEALSKISEGEHEAEIGKEKIPSSIVASAYLTVNLAIARIPILKNRVKKSIDDFKAIGSSQILLQQHMLESTTLMSEYMFQAYRIDSTDKENLTFLSAILKKSKESIDRVGNSVMEFTKEYEYDPFIKFAMISIRIADFKIAKETKKIYLEKAVDYMNKIIKQCVDSKGVSQANQLLNKINQILFRFSIEEEEASKQKDDAEAPA